MLTSKVLIKNIKEWWSTLSYPMAEPDAPDGNMVPCWCSRPEWCSTERMSWRWTASSRAACGHSLKTLWPPFTRAGELDEADAFRRLYSSISCARRRWNGEYCCYGRCGVTKREMTEGGVQNIYYAEDRPKRSLMLWRPRASRHALMSWMQKCLTSSTPTK
jgi:hypothetical protein